MKKLHCLNGATDVFDEFDNALVDLQASNNWPQSKCDREGAGDNQSMVQANLDRIL